jgi:hypothetical protein
MSRRKSEITGHMNERDFPHLVEVALPAGGFRDRSFEFNAFHHERGIPIRRGRGRHEEEQFYVRFCFPDAATADAFRDRFGGGRLTYSSTKLSGRRKSKHQRSYEPRIFDGRVMIPNEIEHIHKEVLEFETIDAISEPMRELIEELWPELVYKLPPKRSLG